MTESATIGILCLYIGLLSRNFGGMVEACWELLNLKCGTLEIVFCHTGVFDDRKLQTSKNCGKSPPHFVD